MRYNVCDLKKVVSYRFINVFVIFDYSKGNALVTFNFAPDLATGCCSPGHLSPAKYGTIRLNVRFAKALTETINALIYLEFDNIVEINQETQYLISHNGYITDTKIIKDFQVF
jgi:hypothetical protein